MKLKYSLEQELALVQHASENAARFADIDGGLHQRSKLFDKKKAVLKLLIATLPDFSPEEGADISASNLTQMLQRIEYEEQYYTTLKISKEYEEMKKQWQSWFQQTVFDMEENFEDVLSHARGIDNPFTKAQIITFEKDKELTEEKRVLFYLAMKTSVLRYRESRGKFPQKVTEPLYKPEVEEVQPDKQD
jgi:hypothetical protein